MSSRLSRYLKKRRRSMVIEYIQDHSHQVTDVVRTVNECLVAWTEDDTPRVKELANIVFQEENIADDLRREVTEKARSPDLSSQAREDLLRLARRVDFIANFCKAASKNVYLLADKTVPTVLRQTALKMSNSLLEQVKILEDAIDTLGTTPTVNTNEQIDYFFKKISNLEHEIDILYFEAKAKYLELADQINAAILIILSDMFRNLENASDFTEGTAELVLAILATDS